MYSGTRQVFSDRGDTVASAAVFVIAIAFRFLTPIFFTKAEQREQGVGKKWCRMAHVTSLIEKDSHLLAYGSVAVVVIVCSHGNYLLH